MDNLKHFLTVQLINLKAIKDCEERTGTTVLVNPTWSIIVMLYNQDVSEFVRDRQFYPIDACSSISHFILSDQSTVDKICGMQYVIVDMDDWKKLHEQLFVDVRRIKYLISYRYKSTIK